MMLYWLRNRWDWEGIQCKIFRNWTRWLLQEQIHESATLNSFDDLMCDKSPLMWSHLDKIHNIERFSHIIHWKSSYQIKIKKCSIDEVLKLVGLFFDALFAAIFLLYFTHNKDSSIENDPGQKWIAKKCIKTIQFNGKTRPDTRLPKSRH